MIAQKHGLGRGLSSLIPQKRDTTRARVSVPQTFARRVDTRPSERTNDNNSGDEYNDQNKRNFVQEVPVAQVRANSQQPRIHFDEDKLDELAASIRTHGVLQPLVAVAKGDHYELIAGERRLRAARKAGLKTVPIFVKDDRELNEQKKLELALIENIQRHDLNLIEEAKSYHKLAEEFDLSQEEIAVRSGKSRSVVANRMRLSTLPIEIQKGLVAGDITEGHAKVILSLTNAQKQIALYQMILQQNLTVRQAENKAHVASGTRHRRRFVEKTPHARRLEDQLTRYFGTKVRVSEGASGGNITVSYFSEEELKNILSRLKLM